VVQAEGKDRHSRIVGSQHPEAPSAPDEVWLQVVARGLISVNPRWRGDLLEHPK
jgi:hypothetical protein